MMKNPSEAALLDKSTMIEPRERRRICNDCGVLEGHIHELGCDMEHCPFCDQQLISCECCYEKLEIDVSSGTWASENGLTDEQEGVWLELLTGKGRIPYIAYPNLCCRCGLNYPTMFDAPDAEWQRYVEPRQRDKMLCGACYDLIKTWIDEGADNRAE